jgi:hypothetical protein
VRESAQQGCGPAEERTAVQIATDLRTGHRSNHATLLDSRTADRGGCPALGTERNVACNLQHGHDRCEVDGDAPCRPEGE